MLRGRVLTGIGLVLGGALVSGCAQRESQASGADLPSAPWVSRTIPEAAGTMAVQPDGARRALRYSGWTAEDFGRFRTYAYTETKSMVPLGTTPLPTVAGNAQNGRRLFLDRNRGPCTGCHLVRGEDVWPAGNVGPDLSSYGDRDAPPEYTFKLIYDSRHIFPESVMPPWGAAGIFTAPEIMDLVAFLATQKGPLPAEKDLERDPGTRRKPAGFGDNLDPTNNPAVVRAEGADDLWAEKGPSGKACVDCHAGGPLASMKGVATRYPRYVPAHRRVMSIEDLLTVHGPATTGRLLLEESADNLELTVRIKMASNGMPVRLDLDLPENRAAFERGRASFFKRVGQRNHACADCHTVESGRGAGKFLGGRLLADVEQGLTRHFPTWRTSQADVWDMRKRMQWCMTPLGANMLAADSVEYAELELYLASFDQGKPISVPGIRH